MAYKKSKKKNEKPEGPIRVRLPRDNQVLGIIEQRVGGQRMMIKCTDGITRNCRVPGRMKRRLWLREGNIVLVELWEFDEERGDIIYKYNPSQVQWLKRKGHLKIDELEF